jgi:hypothetical protein
MGGQTEINKSADRWVAKARVNQHLRNKQPYNLSAVMVPLQPRKEKT